MEKKASFYFYCSTYVIVWVTVMDIKFEFNIIKPLYYTYNNGSEKRRYVTQYY